MNEQLVQNIQYRRDVMRVLALFTCVGGLLFSVLNFYRDIYILSAIELGFCFYSIFLWRIIPTTPHFSTWVLFYIIPCFLVIQYALFLPQSSEAMFVWILTIPLVSYLLLGRQKGFWVSVFFIVLGLIVYHWRFIDDSNSFTLNTAISINVCFSAIMCMAIAHVYELNREKNEQRLLALAGTDKLTGLANRMKLEGGFEHYSLLSKRHNINFIFVLIDLDFFKNINDQYGHDMGDKALCYVADFLKKNIRESDLLARFGGEEFSLLMTSSDIDEAYQHINLIREKLSQHPFIRDNHSIKITMSAGLATYGIDGTSLDSLMKKADERLYMAKSNGRNCIVITDQN
ncbi:GGDEF domain-containing protein [uncultured Paraglaciecola sp.]|uniref:GGDEF domain-containing protein n=1 Tax=uncultured Paraglaciecola sp. TaxID=1765024 RepID=UPI0030D8FD76|tara:strand:- start:492276 stop:493307 length:1032 start_codon:yes stop_codon:yes gene_type:complete